MILGLSATGLRYMSLDRAIALASGLGLEAVEILASREMEDLGAPGVFPWEKDRIAEIKPLLAPFSQINLHAPFHNLEVFTKNPKIRQLAVDHIYWTLDMAETIGASLVNIHFNPGRVNYPDEEKMAEAAGLLREFAEYGRQLGVFLTVENAEYLYPLGKLLVAAEMAGHENCGITLDIGHIFLAHDPPHYLPFEGAGHFIRRIGPLLKNVHLHDCDGQNDHLPLGRGRIRVAQVIEALVREGFGGSLIIESIFRGPEEVLDSLALVRNTIEASGLTDKRGAS